MVRNPRPRKGALTAALMSTALLGAVSALAQAPQSDTPALRGRVDAIIARMTLEQKLEYIGGTDMLIPAVPSVGLPALRMADGPYGTRSNLGLQSTAYAAGINLAASWDRGLADRVGASIGRDARARGVNYMLGPGVNIYRSPRNGRNFEYFGEDPFLAGEIAVGYITGMQDQGVSATIKHFIGNNSEFLRHGSDSIIGERAMREIYLPAFEAAVKKARVGAIMDGYNLTNGLHMTQNKYLNVDVVRKEWGFDGVMMSDWGATYDAIGAANGGLDLEMPTGRMMNPQNLSGPIKAGTVAEAAIDEKVRHLLMTAGRFGWLDRPQADPTLSIYDSRNAAVALEAARGGIVLLKNEGKLLPLDRAQIKSILVVGPTAFPGAPVGGGSAGVEPFRSISALEGIAALAGPGVTVYYDRGLPTISELARTTDFVTAPENGQPGLTLETFDNMELSGTPVSTSRAAHINEDGIRWQVLFARDPALLQQHHRSGQRWSGYYVVPRAGRYVVALQGAGEGNPNRVYLDDKLLFDNWKTVEAFEPSVTLDLSAGPHKIVVETARRSPAGGWLRFGIAAEDEIVTAKARKLAAMADVVVVAAGFNPDNEGEAGDRTFELPFGQDKLIRDMTAANKKTIVNLTAGGNVDSAAWLDRTPAYLMSWYAGQEGGTALGEILFGAVNPSGHLPVTFERRAQDNPTYGNYYTEPNSNRVVYKEGIFVGYRGYDRDKIKPLFPFGYGLSYTSFKFANLSVVPERARAGPGATVSFDVTNTGDRAGAEVAQVYVSNGHAKVERPVKELKGFDKVLLQAGETRRVSVALDSRAFAYYDTKAKGWRIDPGRFGILVGDSSDALPLKGTVEISKAVARSARF